MNPFLNKHEFVDAEKLLGLLEIKNISTYKEIDENSYLVTWKDHVEEVHSAPNTNIVLASFITSAARLRLYEMLEVSRGEAYYTDTGNILLIF